MLMVALEVTAEMRNEARTVIKKVQEWYQLDVLEHCLGRRSRHDCPSLHGPDAQEVKDNVAVLILQTRQPLGISHDQFAEILMQELWWQKKKTHNGQ